MNRHFLFLGVVSLMVSLVTWLPSPVKAASAQEACITGVANQVYLLTPGNSARRAVLRGRIAEGTIIRTGGNSRAELTFGDRTIVRLAADTVFSFTNGSRDLNLGGGAVLVECSKSVRDAKVHAGEIAAAIAGTTVMIEYHSGVCKVLVLEGTGRLYRPAYLGDSVLVGPGQMVIGNPREPVSDPVDFDIGRFVKTSHFIVDLPSLPSAGLIASEARVQQGQKSTKVLIETNMVIYGGGTQVSLVNPVGTDSGSQKKQILKSKGNGARLKRPASPQ